MKKLILTFLSTALVILAVHAYGPVPAECQVGAPCGTAQSSIGAVAAEATFGTAQSTPPPIAISDTVSNPTTATSYLYTYDGSDSLIAKFEGTPTGSLNWTCADVYAAGCQFASAPTVTLSEVKGACVPGTSGTASAELSLVVTAPTPVCNDPFSIAVPAAIPNDQVEITVGDIVTAGFPFAGQDGWATFVSFVSGSEYYPATFDGECGALSSSEEDSEIVATLDETWIAGAAPTATGVCCVPETAYQTPEQSGCLYRGASQLGEVTYYSSRCSAEAVGPGSSNNCVTEFTIIDSGNVCPLDWCTLNPGDPECGGGPD